MIEGKGEGRSKRKRLDTTISRYYATDYFIEATLLLTITNEE